MKSRVALRIKTLRTLRGMSQEQLAIKLDRSVDAVSSIERGKSFPSYETLEKLSSSLEVPVKDFFEFDEHEQSEERIKASTYIIDTIRKMDDQQLQITAETIEVLIKKRQS